MSSALSGKKEKIALVLQGGGALGAYQAGAYERLAEEGYEPDWLAGISIGAINAAIIAGNRPEDRISKLRAFWRGVSCVLPGVPVLPGTGARSIFNLWSSGFAMAYGIPGFFAPRLPPAFLTPPGSSAAISVYDTTPLEKTLEELIDFAILNNGGARLSVGAVNIESGNFEYFDNTETALTVKHIMASAAFPPGLPPIIIDGQSYWDGGLVSNTPLQYVIENNRNHDDLCVFQVDLFSARGPMPKTLLEVAQRIKDIRYSSRTRLNTDAFRRTQRLRTAARRLVEKLPDDLKADPDARFLREASTNAAITIVHLIHRRAAYDLQSKDYDFSRLSVDEHWRDGRTDVDTTFSDATWINRAPSQDGVDVFDLTKVEGANEIDLIKEPRRAYA